MIPAGVIQIRKDLCRGRCKADPLDPCAACENGHWGRYTATDCSSSSSSISRLPSASSLGDKIERIVNLIPGVKSLPCHDQQTRQLRPESPCGKAKARLNAGEPIIPTIIKRIKGE